MRDWSIKLLNRNRKKSENKKINLKNYLELNISPNVMDMILNLNFNEK